MVDPVASREYRALALVSAVLLLVLGLATTGLAGLPYVVIGPQGSVGFVTTGIPAMFCLISAVLTAIAPWIALRLPVVALLLTTLAPLWLLWRYDVWAFTTFAGVLAVAVITLARSRWQAAAMAAGSMVFPLSLTGPTSMSMPNDAQIYLHFGGYSPGDVVLTETLYAVGVVIVMGAAWMLRRYVADSANLVRDAAVLTERARLARDLHDVVAHHVSKIAVRAETAPYTEDDLGEGGRRVLAEIADDARGALDELRGVLGVLRRADGSVETAPQLTGADVAALVEDEAVAASGLEHLAVLPDPAGYVAYRVVQEALTNARRHAPGVPVTLAVATGAGQTTITVRNPVAHEADVVPGAGLTGMRERVEAIGGTLSVERRGDELVVEAVLPS